MIPATDVSTALAPARPRRRLWLWILCLCLAPFVLLVLVVAIGAFSFLTLDRPASALKKQVMAAAGSSWHTQVQLSVGSVTIAAVKTGLVFVHDEKMDEARLALAAVERASVGVYEMRGPGGEVSGAPLVAAADAAMAERGWTRIVGVSEGRQKVLIYAPEKSGTDDAIDLCLAVVDGRQLVVVSTTVRADELGQLIARHRPGDWKKEFGRVGRGL